MAPAQAVGEAFILDDPSMPDLSPDQLKSFFELSVAGTGNLATQEQYNIYM